MAGKYRLTPATCERCGAAFQAKACKVVKGMGRFCSRLCASKTAMDLVDRHKKRGPLADNDPRRTHVPKKAIIQPEIRKNSGLLFLFWSMVDIRGDEECWPWTGCVGADGYGLLRYKRVTYRAARLSWQLHNEEPLGRLVVLHSCDTPKCVNPSHLSAGTHADNMHDMVVKGRASGQNKTHCSQGHEYTPENTYWRSGTFRRRCKQCVLDEQRAYRAKKRSGAAVRGDRSAPVYLPERRLRTWR